MAERKLRVALVAGPMYDGLYAALPEFEKQSGVQVEVGFRGSHPQLNAHLASLAEMPYDLVSTHTKYAPSQLSFLAPLDAILESTELDSFYSPLIDLARIDGMLYGIPRNIDVKLLHYRTDLLREPPKTWNELLAVSTEFADRRRLAGSADKNTALAPPFGFVFPGMESGLFGLFYELAEMGGASLFPDSNVPLLNNEGGVWALGIIRELYRSGAVPSQIIEWHYDEAHLCFRNGCAAMIGDWPGYYGAYRNAAISKVTSKFRVARMPAGPGGARKVYSGCHTFALTRRAIGNSAALDLLRFLTAPEHQSAAARGGSVPPRPALLQEAIRLAEPPEAERWGLLDTVIANDMLIPPAFAYYPEIEEILWRTIRSAMRGELSTEAALLRMERRMIECHRRHAAA